MFNICMDLLPILIIFYLSQILFSVVLPPKNHVVFQNVYKRIYNKYNHQSFFTDNNYDKNDMKLITISPGGFNGFYMMGIVTYIKEHYNLTNFIFSGASAGAWNAIIFAYKYNASDIIDILFDNRNDYEKKSIGNLGCGFQYKKNKDKFFLLDLENSIKNRILDKFSTNDFNLDRLFIGMTTLQLNGVMVSSSPIFQF